MCIISTLDTYDLSILETTKSHFVFDKLNALIRISCVSRRKIFTLKANHLPIWKIKAWNITFAKITIIKKECGVWSGMLKSLKITLRWFCWALTTNIQSKTLFKKLTQTSQPIPFRICYPIKDFKSFCTTSCLIIQFHATIVVKTKTISLSSEKWFHTS